MSVESFDPTAGALVEVTPEALSHFKKQLAANTAGAQAVRLSVKESGCTGFMYVLDLVAEPAQGDEILPLEGNVSLYVDRQSIPVVRGTKIDFVTEGVNRQLAFLNPNARDYCGCGESFNIG